jgi:hypothetical protein
VKIATAITLFKLVVAIVGYFQQQRWYQEGRAAAYADMDEEQRKRVAMAEAARADADAFATGELHDPRQRD